MTTFFPHLYEYCKAVNLIKEYHPEIIHKKERNAKLKKGRFNETKNKTQTKQLKMPRCFLQLERSKDIDFLIYLEQKAQNLRESSYYPVEFYSANIETILKEKTELSKINNYEKLVEWPLNEKMLEHQYQDQFKVVGRHWMLVDYVLCIELAKSVPFFCKLNIYDQKSLLKSTLISNKFLTEAFYSFKASSDVLIFPDGLIPIKMPIIHSTQKDLFGRVVEPVKRIQMTKEEFVLLKIIILCSTNSETISDYGRKMLESERERYCRLLLNHLQAKYGDAPGAVRYSQILSVMEAMTYFTQKAKEFYIFVSTIERFHSFPTLRLLDQIVIQN